MMYAPYNAITGNLYQGQINVIALTNKARALNTDDPRWLTFLQAQEKGYKVKKGAKGTKVFYLSYTEEKVNDEVKRRTVYKQYYVFNASEVEGIPSL